MSNNDSQEPLKKKKAYLQITEEFLLSVDVEAESPEEALKITERKLREFTGEPTPDIKIIATRWRESKIVEDASMGDSLEKCVPAGLA